MHEVSSVSKDDDDEDDLKKMGLCSDEGGEVEELYCSEGI